MSKYVNQINKQVNTLYNSILLLSRNKLFYTTFDLIDTFQNRIHLVFTHVSFIFIKSKVSKDHKIYKNFHQKVFDLIFNNIETNMREIGYGDTVINKNMKSLTKTFYNILFDCEKYRVMTKSAKCIFFNKYLKLNDIKNITNNAEIIEYFNKYEAFCFDLSHDSVLKGEFKFNYK